MKVKTMLKLFSIAKEIHRKARGLKRGESERKNQRSFIGIVMKNNVIGKRKTGRLRLRICGGLCYQKCRSGEIRSTMRRGRTEICREIYAYRIGLIRRYFLQKNKNKKLYNKNN